MDRESILVLGLALSGPVGLYLFRVIAWHLRCRAFTDVRNQWSVLLGVQLRTVAPIREAHVTTWSGSLTTPRCWRVFSQCDIGTDLKLSHIGIFKAGSAIKSGDERFDGSFSVDGGSAGLIRDLFLEQDVRDATRALFERNVVGGMRIDRGGRATISVRRSGFDPSEARAAMLAFVTLLDVLEGFVEDDADVQP